MSMQWQGSGSVDGTTVAVVSSDLTLRREPIIPDIVGGGNRFRANYAPGRKLGGGSMTFAVTSGSLASIKAQLISQEPEPTEIELSVDNGAVSTSVSGLVENFSLGADAVSNSFIQASCGVIGKTATISGGGGGGGGIAAHFIPSYSADCSSSAGGTPIRFDMSITSDVFLLYVLNTLSSDGTPTGIQAGLVKATGSVATYGGGGFSSDTFTGSFGAGGTAFGIIGVTTGILNDVTGPNDKPFQVVRWEAVGSACIS